MAWTSGSLKVVKLKKIPSTPVRSNWVSVQLTMVSANDCAMAPALVARSMATAEDEWHDHRRLVGAGISTQRRGHLAS